MGRGIGGMVCFNEILQPIMDLKEIVVEAQNVASEVPINFPAILVMVAEACAQFAQQALEAVEPLGATVKSINIPSEEIDALVTKSQEAVQSVKNWINTVQEILKTMGLCSCFGSAKELVMRELKNRAPDLSAAEQAGGLIVVAIKLIADLISSTGDLGVLADMTENPADL